MCINARGAVSTATLGLMALIWDGLHEEERAVLVLLQVLNKVGRSLEGVIHRRVERGERVHVSGEYEQAQNVLGLE